VSGYNPGKKRLIEKWLPKEAWQNGTRWYMQAELSCGHIVDVSIGGSPNHRRPGTRQAIMSARCLQCFKEEQGIK